jgi:hypothetical protein
LQELTGYDKQYWGEVADGSREHGRLATMSDNDRNEAREAAKERGEDE